MAFVEPRTVPAPSDANLNGSGVSPADAAAAAPSAPYKRTGQSRPQLLKKFRQRVQMSKKWRKDEGYDDTWSRLVDIYSNKMFEDKDGDDDQIAVNISFSTINTIGPAVSVSYPNITVNPRSPELEEAAEAVEAAVNYWFRHYDWRKETKRAVKDSLTIGHGWAKVWWKYAEGTRPLTAQEQAQNLADAQAQAGDAAEQDPANAHLQPTDQQLADSNPTTTAHVIMDQPCVERVSPRDIVIDPEATCDDDLGWIAQKIVRPLTAVKADTSYTAAGRNAVQADAGTNPRWRDEADTGATRAYADDIKRVTLYEFYDLRNNFYCVFAENGGDAFLLEPTELPYPYGHPFVYLGNYDVPDAFYDIGDLEALEPLQMELNAVRSDMRNHRKRYQRAHLALRDKFTTEAQRVLEDPTDGRIIWIEGDEDLTRLAVPLPQESLDPQMYQYSEQIESDIDLVSGVSEYQRGAQSEIRRTATEAAMINDASNARSADKLTQVEVFLQEIARRVVQLAQKYLTGDHVVSIIGQDGAKKWIPYDNPTIQGEFDFTVEAGSTQPQDENFKRQQALQLAQTLAPYVGTSVDPGALVMYILKDGFGVKNPEQFLMQAPPPQQGPSQKFIETMAYKDAPPDIQRQMEAEAGFKPSAIGGGMPPQQPGPGDDTEPDPNDPNEQQEQAQGEPPEVGGAMGASAPQTGANIDPRILAQLQAQVGLNDPNAGAPAPQ